MASRPNSDTPHSKKMSRQELERNIVKLERRIDEAEKLDILRLSGAGDPVLRALGTSIHTTLDDVFGHGTTEEQRFRTAGYFSSNQPPSIGELSRLLHGGRRSSGPDQGQVRQGIQKSIAENIAVLGAAVNLLKERLADEDLVEGPKVASAAGKVREVFIVHGHDEGARESVARCLEKMSFGAIILNEQANKGRSLIEKLEANSAVGFAVVLMTPDDDCTAEGKATKRARQNVILELGYFIGYLGRDRICVLKKGDVEVPSDLLGLVAEPLDEGGAWQIKLRNELRAAGYQAELP